MELKYKNTIIQYPDNTYLVFVKEIKEAIDKVLSEGYSISSSIQLAHFTKELLESYEPERVHFLYQELAGVYRIKEKIILLNADYIDKNNKVINQYNNEIQSNNSNNKTFRDIVYHELGHHNHNQKIDINDFSITEDEIIYYLGSAVISQNKINEREFVASVFCGLMNNIEYPEKFINAALLAIGNT